VARVRKVQLVAHDSLDHAQTGVLDAKMASGSCDSDGPMNVKMKQVALIDNPASGQPTPRRSEIVRHTLDSLRQAGLQVEHMVIDGPGSGAALARDAIASGCDTILVCGGDGTVHEVLQCLVGTNVALGVVPLGTANALAANLGLSKSPGLAIKALLAAIPTQVPVGQIFYYDEDGSSRSRYFTVAAGAGADALLMSRLDAGLKQRFGYLLYVLEAVRIWATHPFPLFKASFTDRTGNNGRVEEISQLLAVRVRSFGGVLGEVAPGATLHNQGLCLLAFKTRSRLNYMRFLLAVMFGRHTFKRQIELIDAKSVECTPCSSSTAPVYVEADGEVLGHLPARVEIAAETLTLLIPPNAQP
jgi:diacylglycerol kinase family enzyme